MSVTLVTGSGGLIGSESARFFAKERFDVIGLDNDMRACCFGAEASTRPSSARLAGEHCPSARFVFISTNKVYGNRPNYLPLVEFETRWELPGITSGSEGFRSRCRSIAAPTRCSALSDEARIGDHQWYVSDFETFDADYPEWRLTYGVEDVLKEIYEHNAEHWQATK
jgi:hypothetical protein